MTIWQPSPRKRFLVALGVSTLVSIGLFAYDAWRKHNLSYDYLSWNLLLAWLPLLFSIGLIHCLRHKLWSSWEGIGWSLLWLIFLPNSFYLISDFVHLQELQSTDLLYYVLMFTSFVYTGVILGFSSLYLVHVQLKRRLPSSLATTWLAAVLLICSAAVYTGRDLRWNSWDVLINPGGLLVDLSSRLLHASAYPQMIVDIVSLFVLLGSMYALLWQGARLLQSATSKS